MKGWCEEDGNAVRGVEGWTWDRIWGAKRGLRSRGKHLRPHSDGGGGWMVVRREWRRDGGVKINEKSVYLGSVRAVA